MHPNTRLTPYSRGKMLKDYKAGVLVSILTQQYGISRATFYRWRKRFLGEGEHGLINRSSRPHRIRCRLTDSQAEEVVHLRLTRRWGPLRLAPLVRIPPTTIYRCLRGCGLGKLPNPPHPAVVRYEAKAPGELVHLDVLHLFALKGQKPAYQFTVVDDYTRLAYALIAPHRTTQAALEAMDKAQTSFGFSIKRVLTDNDVTFAWTFRPNWKGPQGGITRFTKTMQSWGIHHSLTRIRRPQTNGKVERFHRTIREELYRAHPLFQSEEERVTALVQYLKYYNTQRFHTAIGGITPIQRRDLYSQSLKVSTTS